MKEILALEHLGYSFSIEDQRLRYRYLNEPPFPQEAQVLLEKLKHHQEEAFQFIVARQSVVEQLRGFRIRWRPGAAVGVVSGHWHFQPDGTMLADYTPDELSLVLAAAGYSIPQEQIVDELGHCMQDLPSHWEDG